MADDMAGEYDLLLRDAWPGDSEMLKELRAVVVACILEQFGELPPIEILVGLSAQERAAIVTAGAKVCLLYTSPSPRDQRGSRMPSSA